MASAVSDYVKNSGRNLKDTVERDWDSLKRGANEQVRMWGGNRDSSKGRTKRKAGRGSSR